MCFCGGVDLPITLASSAPRHSERQQDLIGAYRELNFRRYEMYSSRHVPRALKRTLVADRHFTFGFGFPFS